ncbi:MAG: DNA methyltransferase [Chitinophagaceae bacterium]
MNFPSIDIQGSILSTDLLGKIRSEQANFQQGKDFNPDLTNAKLKDEISLAWQEAKGQWTIYKSKLTRLKDGETGTTETRNFWISPLLTNLNYNLSFNRASEELNGKSFPIGYRDSNLDNFPVYVGGYNESLDKRPENKQLRVSPHAMLQEYLNYSEHLYGIVTNGRQLRLLRDASRITRLSYVEFNLEKIMEEDLYSDFVILYRVLHASRMPKKVDAGAESIMEKYHQEGLEAGSTIRNKLGEAVKGAIKNLANGFINHPNNAVLREAVAAGNINADEYYRHQLRIIYRLLFLFVIEERNLVYADSKTPETKRFNQIYFNYYSLLRLRKLARKLLPPEANRHYDLWQSLVSTFSLFEKKEIGEKLGIMSLQGDLFGYNAISNDHYDLHQCYLSNALILNIIKSLSYFENDNGVLIAVNYGGLDVEEFGSVYEGLLELKLEFNKVEGSDNYSVNWKKQDGGREFQSHYTPEELVQPLIKHSLEYLIEDILLLYAQKKVNKENTIKALLKLKVCDVACGSGHILLSAARRIALAVARVQTDEEQPNPLAIRKAMKDVVRNCIYGVDKNPLAVELCKIALWLEAYNPGEPLNFLDHHIKCGDAIVGLAHRKELENGIANESFSELTGDDKSIAKAFRDRNTSERKSKEQQQLDFEGTVNEELKVVIEKFNLFKNLPERSPEEVEKKAKEHIKYEQDYHRIRLKQLADAQIAQFFIPKTDANKDVLITDAEYRNFLRQVNKHLGILQSNKLVKAQLLADKNHKNFFHWFLEFPEVFNEGGFDCILGNPPYLGFKKITTNFGPSYNEYIKCIWPEKGKADFITYFFRRIYSLIKEKGFQSLITTNTISQGDTRVVGLDVLVKNGASINFAIRSMKWPGVAAVDVALVSIFKGQWEKDHFLNNAKVSNISTLLDDVVYTSHPYRLFILDDIYFQGSVIRGNGFLISMEEADMLIALDKKNKEVIKYYYTGDDINNHPQLLSTRRIIDFQDWSEHKSKGYSECWKIVEENVKSEREEILSKSNQVHENKFWIHWDRRAALYNMANKYEKVLAISMQATKYPNFEFIESGNIFSNSLGIICTQSFFLYTFLNSSFHNEWAYKYASLLETRLRYSSSDIFYTFPFPEKLSKQQEDQIEVIGKAFHAYRRELMINIQLGLTKTYNLFHSNAINTVSINEKDKQIAALEKHLEKIAVTTKGGAPKTLSFEEAIHGILKLRELYQELNTAVLNVYAWNDIELKYDFYEVDYLPENDRTRYTIHPDARKEVLKRLLALNHKIHEEEEAGGLLDKKKTVGKKTGVVKEPDAGYGGDLFNQ